MRVSDRWMYERGSLELQRNRSASAKAADEVSSGVRVNHPWEDPAAAGLGAGHDVNQRRLDAMVTSIDRASDEISSMDAGLGDLGELLSRGRELAVQLSNDSYTAGERAGAASEVFGLCQSAVATLNRQVGGRYVFGGCMDGADPFDPAGNYMGDNKTRQVELASGVWQDVSIRSDVTVKGASGGVDVFKTFTDLTNALATNDTTTIRASIDALSACITQVAQGRSRLGTQQAVLEVASGALRASSIDEQKLRADELEADPFDAATRMAASERALEASIEAISRSGKLSLLGKM